MFSKICILLVVQLACAALVDHNDCSNVKCSSVPKHYEEMGCEAETFEGECCPSSYKCPDLTSRDGDKCHYKSEIVKTGEYLKSSALGGMCSAACYCRNGRDEKPAEFQCAHVDCPEFFAGQQLKENCVRQYNKNRCCAIKTVCDDEMEKLSTCEFEGETYREGEKMYPEEHCYECFCRKDYDSEIPIEENQHCNKIDCGISLRNTGRIIEGCIPVYYKTDNCCPIGWRCPGDKHMQERETSGKSNDTSPKCKFGKMEFSIGESLDLEKEKCQKCTCTTPPMLHCLEIC